MGHLALIVAGSGFVVLLASAIAVGLGYLAAAVAFDKGRSELAWAGLSIATASAAGTLGAALARRALDGDSPASLALFTVFLPPLLAGAGSVSIIAWLHRLAPRAARGPRWPVYRLGNDAASGPGVLELAAGELRLRAGDQPELVVPLADLVAARADGECVRLERHAGARRERIVLLPTRGPDDRAFRAHQSAAIAARIAAAPGAAISRG